MVNCSSLGPSNSPGSLKPTLGDPEAETGNLETEKRVHRSHDTLEAGLQIIGAPTRGSSGLGYLQLDINPFAMKMPRRTQQITIKICGVLK